MEWKLFSGDVPYVSTFDYHKDRERAPHLEQSDHRGRMELALKFILKCSPESIADLGCGDGGMLQLIKAALPESRMLGFDFTPSMHAGWVERGVADHCQSRNVFPIPPWPAIDPLIEDMLNAVDVTVVTEILEHISRPHEALSRINSRYLVASSPWNETDRVHADCHAWAWDMEGFASIIESAGFGILDHAKSGSSQVVRAINRR